MSSFPNEIRDSIERVISFYASSAASLNPQQNKSNFSHLLFHLDKVDRFLNKNDGRGSQEAFESVMYIMSFHPAFFRSLLSRCVSPPYVTTSSNSNFLVPSNTPSPSSFPYFDPPEVWIASISCLLVLFNAYLSSKDSSLEAYLKNSLSLKESHYIKLVSISKKTLSMLTSSSPSRFFYLTNFTTNSNVVSPSSILQHSFSLSFNIILTLCSSPLFEILSISNPNPLFSSLLFSTLSSLPSLSSLSQSSISRILTNHLSSLIKQFTSLSLHKATIVFRDNSKVADSVRLLFYELQRLSVRPSEHSSGSSGLLFCDFLGIFGLLSQSETIPTLPPLVLVLLKCYAAICSKFSIYLYGDFNFNTTSYKEEEEDASTSPASSAKPRHNASSNSFIDLTDDSNTSSWSKEDKTNFTYEENRNGCFSLEAALPGIKSFHLGFNTLLTGLILSLTSGPQSYSRFFSSAPPSTLTNLFIVMAPLVVSYSPSVRHLSRNFLYILLLTEMDRKVSSSSPSSFLSTQYEIIMEKVGKNEHTSSSPSLSQIFHLQPSPNFSTSLSSSFSSSRPLSSIFSLAQLPLDLLISFARGIHLIFSDSSSFDLYIFSNMKNNNSSASNISSINNLFSIFTNLSGKNYYFVSLKQLNPALEVIFRRFYLLHQDLVRLGTSELSQSFTQLQGLVEDILKKLVNFNLITLSPAIISLFKDFSTLASQPSSYSQRQGQGQAPPPLLSSDGFKQVKAISKIIKGFVDAGILIPPQSNQISDYFIRPTDKKPVNLESKAALFLDEGRKRVIEIDVNEELRKKRRKDNAELAFFSSLEREEEVSSSHQLSQIEIMRRMRQYNQTEEEVIESHNRSLRGRAPGGSSTSSASSTSTFVNVNKKKNEWNLQLEEMKREKEAARQKALAKMKESGQDVVHRDDFRLAPAYVNNFFKETEVAEDKTLTAPMPVPTYKPPPASLTFSLNFGGAPPEPEQSKPAANSSSFLSSIDYDTLRVMMDNRTESSAPATSSSSSSMSSSFNAIPISSLVINTLKGLTISNSLQHLDISHIILAIIRKPLSDLLKLNQDQNKDHRGLSQFDDEYHYFKHFLPLLFEEFKATLSADLTEKNKLRFLSKCFKVEEIIDDDKGEKEKESFFSLETQTESLNNSLALSSLKHEDFVEVLFRETENSSKESLELMVDDLVIIIKKESDKDKQREYDRNYRGRSRDRDYYRGRSRDRDRGRETYSSSSFGSKLTLEDLTQSRHCLGVVRCSFSASHANASVKGKKDDRVLNFGHKNSIVVDKKYHFSLDKEYIIVSLLNLSTFTREWNAMMTLKTKDINLQALINSSLTPEAGTKEVTELISLNNLTSNLNLMKLFPLAPYLLFGRPIISLQYIFDKEDKILLKFNNFETAVNYNQEEKSSKKTFYLTTTLVLLLKNIVRDLDDLFCVNVNAYILRKTGIVKTLKTLAKNMKKYEENINFKSTNKISKAHDESLLITINDKAIALLNKWKADVNSHSDQKKFNYLNSSSKNIINLKQVKESEKLSVPPKISSKMWQKITTSFSFSQAMAIKYVLTQSLTLEDDDTKQNKAETSSGTNSDSEVSPVDKPEERDREKDKEKIIQDTRVVLIQGPPGSGKTSTIVGIVSSLLEDPVSSVSSTRILICAPSNAAIDELLLRLSSQVFDSEGVKPINIVRIGNVSDISHKTEDNEENQAKNLSLNYQVSVLIKKNAIYLTYLKIVENIRYVEQEIQNFKNQSNNFDNEDSKKHLYTLNSRLRSFLSLKSSFIKRLYALTRNISIQLIKRAHIVGSTLSGARSKVLRDCLDNNKEEEIDDTYLIPEEIRKIMENNDKKFGSSLKLSDINIKKEKSYTKSDKKNSLSFNGFPIVIIDEAAQASEPSTLCPLSLGCKLLILVGDPRQLPPTILSSTSSTSSLLGRSLFERLESANHEVIMLTEQFRMHPGKIFFLLIKFSFQLYF